MSCCDHACSRRVNACYDETFVQTIQPRECSVHQYTILPNHATRNPNRITTMYTQSEIERSDGLTVSFLYIGRNCVALVESASNCAGNEWRVCRHDNFVSEISFIAVV